MTTVGSEATKAPESGAVQDDGPAPARSRSRLRRTGAVLAKRPYLVTALLVFLLAVTGISGADWPAQIFRTQLLREHGALLWNNQWYGGHLLPGYSVLTPLLSSAIGTRTLTALACITSAWLFYKLKVGRTPLARGVGSLWFAVMMSVEYLIGRTPFVLGVALGLLALLAARHNRLGWTAAAALLAGLASPLSGAFLLLLAAAWIPREREWATRFSFAPALVGIGAALLFPNAGDFPFPWWRFWPIVAFAVVGMLVVPKAHKSARRFLLMYAAVAIVFFFIPSALGGNLARLGEMMAGPAMAIVLLSVGRRRLVALLAVPLLVWQFQSAALAITFDVKDPESKKSEYYDGVIDFLAAQNRPVGRVEIPFTRGHWETVFVADKQPMARGWERQLDRYYNAVLYNPHMTAEQYRGWVEETGVRFIAVPDAPLDFSAKREVELIDAGLPWLKPVWSDKHWKVWEVQNPKPLLTGPGTLTELSVKGFKFNAEAPGTFIVRIHPTNWFTPDRNGVEIKPTHDDWTQITVDTPGPVTITTRESKMLD